MCGESILLQPFSLHPAPAVLNCLPTTIPSLEPGVCAHCALCLTSCSAVPIPLWNSFHCWAAGNPITCLVTLADCLETGPCSCCWR